MRLFQPASTPIFYGYEDTDPSFFDRAIADAIIGTTEVYEGAKSGECNPTAGAGVGCYEKDTPALTEDDVTLYHFYTNAGATECYFCGWINGANYCYCGYLPGSSKHIIRIVSGTTNNYIQTDTTPNLVGNWTKYRCKFSISGGVITAQLYCNDTLVVECSRSYAANQTDLRIGVVKHAGLAFDFYNDNITRGKLARSVVIA